MTFRIVFQFKLALILVGIVYCTSVFAILEGDLNRDGIINFIDSGIFSSSFLECTASFEDTFHGDHCGTSVTVQGCNTDADFNGDGLVNFQDLAIFSQNFLAVDFTADLHRFSGAPFVTGSNNFVDLHFAAGINPDLQLSDIQLTVLGDSWGSTDSVVFPNDIASIEHPYNEDDTWARIYLGNGYNLRFGGVARQDLTVAGSSSGIDIDGASFQDITDRRNGGTTATIDSIFKSFDLAYDQEKREDMLGQATSGKARQYYDLSTDLEGVLSMYEASRDSCYLKNAMFYADAMLAATTDCPYPDANWPNDCDRDGFRDFNSIALGPTGYNLPLNDWRGFRPVARLVRLLSEDDVLAGRYSPKLAKYQQFVEHDLIVKWSRDAETAEVVMTEVEVLVDGVLQLQLQPICDSANHNPEYEMPVDGFYPTCLPNGVRFIDDDNVINRASHFGDILVDAIAAEDPRDQVKVDELTTLLDRVCYDLKPLSLPSGAMAVEWDIRMYDVGVVEPDISPFHGCIGGNCSGGTDEERGAGGGISDVSHANGVVSFLTASESRLEFACVNRDILLELDTTFLEVIAEPSETHSDGYLFADFVDGFPIDPPKQGCPTQNGNFLGRKITDGWVKLGESSADMQELMYTFYVNLQGMNPETCALPSNLQLQFYGNLARNFALSTWH